jgi:hypothetical protein
MVMHLGTLGPFNVEGSGENEFQLIVRMIEETPSRFFWEIVEPDVDRYTHLTINWFTSLSTLRHQTFEL